MKKCFLFDLDGVLVDACHWHYVSLNKALKQVKNIEISFDDHILRFNGLPTSKKLKMLNISGKDKELVWSLKQKMTIETINKHANIDKEKIKLHKFIKDKGHVIACVTNSIRLTAELMLLKTGQLDFMDLIITNQDVTNSKPNSECYLKAIDELGFTGKESMVYIIEDSEKGKAAARGTAANLIEVNDPSDVTLEKLMRYI